MKTMRLLLIVFGFCLLLAVPLTATAQVPRGADPSDQQLQLGLLDVTKAPYLADPNGAKDATEAIQRAVNDARDHWLVCFFPEGTYLISDTISCEQQVEKLEQPRAVDGTTQHYWDKSHRIVLWGSTTGKRPVLKLARDAKGFDDPAHSKIAVKIWAQTRDDERDKQEPTWGKEQPNISFSHVFKGIDIDIRGHAGAIGLRHSGSQGSTMQDSTIYAEGAYAGLSNCCGQGGGTYNFEVLGGRYGIVIAPNSRFPILTACTFKGQTEAAIRYTEGGSQVPTLLVGCLLETAGKVAVDFTTERGYAGISMVDCVVATAPGGVVAATRKSENIFLENTYVRGAGSIVTGGAPLPAPEGWSLVRLFSSHTAQGVNLINGKQGSGEVDELEKAAAEPVIDNIRRRHYERTPSFEDADAVNVKAFGAKGDGTTDDSAAFKKAIAAGDKVFVPKGNYRLSGSLQLKPSTQLFGLTRTFSTLGGEGFGRGRGKGAPKAAGAGGGNSLTIATVDAADAAPGLFFLGIRSRIDWCSGRGTCMLAGSPAISGHGGGRFYGMTAMGGQLVLSGIKSPASFYALNVERVRQNPQSVIRDSEHVRIYYFKVESGTAGRGVEDANTPGAIVDSRDVRVYCMYGNVKNLGQKPMLEIANCDDIIVSQLKAFQPSSFPHLRETRGEQKAELPSSNICALFVRKP